MEYSMNMFETALLTRIIATSVLGLLWFLQHMPNMFMISAACILWALDVMDCYVAKYIHTQKIKKCGDYTEYTAPDKIIDLLQYGVFIIIALILSIPSSNSRVTILIAAFLFRYIGVYWAINVKQFRSERDIRHVLVFFPDVIKELLITFPLMSLIGYNHLSGDIYALIATLIIKIPTEIILFIRSN